MISQYGLCFMDPVPAEEVSDIFTAEDYPVYAKTVFPHFYMLKTELSFSEVKHALSFYYFGEHEFRNYAIVKLKNGSEANVICQP